MGSGEWLLMGTGSLSENIFNLGGGECIIVTEYTTLWIYIDLCNLNDWILWYINDNKAWDILQG